MTRKHIVVTGGAGFIGHHVCREALADGHTVTAIDNLSTGNYANIQPLRENPSFTFRRADITQPVAVADLVGVTHIVHLACPASPKANTRMPLDTILASSVGTLTMLDLAARSDARIVCASSSEIYGDPLEHPQTETYRGNCDPIGPFSAYTEGKRVLEAACAAHHRQGTNVAVVRPFNVYGPGMWPDDGRVVASFCAAALTHQTLHIAGGGKQTRSLIYIDDFVDALFCALEHDAFGPVNIGNDDEVTIAELAELVVELAGSGNLEIVPARAAEVAVRRPDTSRARDMLGWQASTSLRDGIGLTLDWMREILSVTGQAAR
ncbi:NAD-dependent epimerase/dehydratase family protein [Nocardia sp. CC227C]|uniref:NAD-dependent epimerase/dehydratase family protein n=1 Tax=Nocardia sp. CC227C TaxID=3044562 RepID=UPI00278BB2B1|nr:NAD-dependent epimerase/dehydratase family protein [Nocardia sp. CC227C]